MKLELFSLRRVLFGCALVCSSVAVRAQCLEWSDRFGSPGVSGNVFAVANFDDGTGEALYVGGLFYSAGGAPAMNIARWDGSAWSTLGDGLGTPFNDRVYALAVFDDGNGPALYAAGIFQSASGTPVDNIARWDGSRWSAVGSDTHFNYLSGLIVHDDGSGPALYAAGQFAQSSGAPGNSIARWDGTQWSALGTGVTHSQFTAWAGSLASFDDGNGLALYVGGNFEQAGSVAVDNLARWDGSSWSRPGTNVEFGLVFALAGFDDGSGPALYAVSEHTIVSGADTGHVARFAGGSWSAVGSGFNGGAGALRVFDDGGGAALYAGGAFTLADGQPAKNVARWNGASWSEPPGLAMDLEAPQTGVSCFCEFDDGSGNPALCIAGNFVTAAGQTLDNVALYRDAQCSGLGQGMSPSGFVRAFAVFDDGSGQALYAGGSFTNAGPTKATRVARWNGVQWSAVGAAVSDPFGGQYVASLCAFNDGSGPALYAGGSFQTIGGVSAANVAKWDGGGWSALGSGVNGAVDALAIFDDGQGGGPALYVAGLFSLAGGASANAIARWDGAQWSAVSTGTNGRVRSLAVFDDGSGPALFLGGLFTQAGATSAHSIAKWDGVQFTTLGAGITPDFPVRALSIWNDHSGNGAALYAAGDFTAVDNLPANFIARWDGTSWSTLGSGMDAVVSSLQAFDDNSGGGRSLYASGQFTHAGGVEAHHIARWNGTSWSALESGLGPYTVGPQLDSAMIVFDDGQGGGPDLYVGGTFNTAGGGAASHIAQWYGCADSSASFCFGDGLDAFVTTPCPCANFGAAGHGCGNSVFTGGALLSATGTTQPDTIVLAVADVPPGVSTIFLQGNATIASGVAFGDGVRCAGGSLVRLALKNADVNGTASYPQFGDAPLSIQSAVQSGATLQYQTYYRNPNATWCPPATFNITNGERLSW